MKDLSIVIPCYNCEDNILILLEFIIKKIYQYRSETEIEIIIVNDGSTDTTIDVLSDFQHYPFIKIFNIENSGAAKAREYGMSHAEGDYIFFCDSDDKVSDDFFDVFVKYHGMYDVIYFSSYISDLNDNKLYDKIKFKNDFIPSSPQDLFKFLLKKGMWTAAVWTYIFKRDVAYKSKASFTDRIAHEDHLFTLRILFSANKIFCDSRLGYIQYSTPNSLTKKINSYHYIYQRFLAYREAEYFIKPQVSNENKFLYKKWSIYSYIRLIYSSDLSLIKKTTLLSILYSEFHVILKVLFQKISNKAYKSRR